MVRVLTIMLLVLLTARAEPIVVKDKEVKVGSRYFSYYCLDGKLWLETKNTYSDDTSTFVQVYRTNHTNMPMECSYNPDGSIRYEGQVTR